MIRETLKNIIGILAGLVTFGQMFTGVFFCRVIYLNGSTKNIPSIQFIAGLVLSILFLQQGLIMHESHVNLINFLGIVLNAVYLHFYYLWSTREVRVALIKKLIVAGFCVTTLILYANLEQPALVESRFGFIVTIVLLMFTAAPLISLPKVINNKSTKSLPYPVIISGFAVSLLWLLYSILIRNRVLFIQNGLAALLGGIQLMLFAIYPDKSLNRNQLQNGILRLKRFTQLNYEK